MELFGRFVSFTYAIWDRIVLRGYYERLQRPENIVYFFHEVCDIGCITPAVLARRTEHYRKWVEGYARRRGIELVIAPKGVRKDEFVAQYYKRFRGGEGVVVILKSMEQGPTFISFEPRFAPPSGSDYRLIKRAPQKRFLHYYFYILDPVMGPMSLRVGTYLPFTLGCIMNGHSYLAQALQREGVRFAKDGNAIIRCTEPDALIRLAAALDEQMIRARANYWAWRLAPSFTARERRRCKLQYEWSVAQIELAKDVIFKRRAPLRELFRRATEIGVGIGGATQTRNIFGRRIDRRYKGKLETVLDCKDEGQPVLRGYYKTSFVKQYEKGDRLLRTEACLNDPYHLGVGRKLENLSTLKDRLAPATDRYLEQQSELLDSTVNTGMLAQLAQPIVNGNKRIPGIKLHDQRVMRLLDVILHSGGIMNDWTTRDVHARLLARYRIQERDYTINQLRYDLNKLRGHGLVQRVGKSYRYRLTDNGIRRGVVLVKAHDRLLGPLLAHAVVDRSKRSANPSKVEAALRTVNKSIDELCTELGLRFAA